MRFILDWDLNMTGFHSCIITPPEGLIQYITRHICPAANRRPSMTKPIRIRNTRKLCLVMNALFANMVYNWRTLQSLDWLYLLFICCLWPLTVNQLLCYAFISSNLRGPCYTHPQHEPYNMWCECKMAQTMYCLTKTYVWLVPVAVSYRHSEIPYCVRYLAYSWAANQASFHDKTHSHTKHEDLGLAMNSPCANDVHKWQTL